MKKKTVMTSVAFAAVVLLASAMPATDPITQEDGATVVNTTTLAKDVKGFKGQTPVKIYIKKGKVVKIEALKNRETPQFFGKAKVVLAKFEGLRVSKAAKLKVDGVTGATYSSKALVQNVQAGLKYYEAHR